MVKATNEQLIKSYSRLKSVWGVASEFGMCGQNVWERLNKLGINTENRGKWTNAQLKYLIQSYSVDSKTLVNIDKLSLELGRLKSNVSRKARELGLTSRFRKKTPEVCETIGKRAKKWIQENGYPRGAYKVGKEVRVCPRCNRFFDVFPSSKQKYCGFKCGRTHPQSEGNQGYSKSGKRADLGDQYFRSRWEANYARYLNFLIEEGTDIVRWEFEKESFEFAKIKKGTRFYTPDFKIYFKDGHIEYHEVKGWDYPKGKTARKRFAKYYPKLKLVLLDKTFFQAFKQQGIDKLIEGWE